MALVTDAILELTLAGVKTDFGTAYRQAAENAEWKFIASDSPTTLPVQPYAWLGRGAVMQEVYDEAFEQTAIQKVYTLTDAEWKAYMSIDRKAIEDDQYNEITIAASAMGEEPIRHQNELIFTSLATGFVNNCYDGTTFFSSSHSEGSSGTQSNVTSSPLSDSALQVARASMTSVVDDKGKPMHVRPDTLVVGPSKEYQAMNLMNSEVVVHLPGDGTAGSGANAYTNFGNFWKGKAKVLVNPYLVGAYADYWFYLDTSRRVKPLILQTRSDVPITFETDMLDPKARMKGKFMIGPRGRYQAGYSLWQLAYGSNASS